MPHHQDKVGHESHSLKDWEPKRHQPAHARILQSDEGAVREIAFQNLNQARSDIPRYLPLDPIGRQRLVIVPTRPQRTQQLVMQRDNLRVFPIPLFVVFPWWKKTFAEIYAEQLERAAQGGSSTAVHAENHNSLPRAGSGGKSYSFAFRRARRSLGRRAARPDSGSAAAS